MGPRDAIGDGDVVAGYLVDDPDRRQAARVIHDDPLDRCLVLSPPRRQQIVRAVVDPKQAQSGADQPAVLERQKSSKKRAGGTIGGTR